MGRWGNERIPGMGLYRSDHATTRQYLHLHISLIPRSSFRGGSRRGKCGTTPFRTLGMRKLGWNDDAIALPGVEPTLDPALRPGMGPDNPGGTTSVNHRTRASSLFADDRDVYTPPVLSGIARRRTGWLTQEEIGRAHV